MLLPAPIVKPFVQGNTKLTIMTRWRSSNRSGHRTVLVKTEQQKDLQVLHE